MACRHIVVEAGREFVAGLGGQVHLEYLPAYAPELNPVEYIWGTTVP